MFAGDSNLFSRLVTIYCMFQNACEEIWNFLVSPFYDYLESVSSISPLGAIIKAIIDAFNLEGYLSDVTMLEMLFGGLLITVILLNVVKWIVELLPVV